MKTLAIDTSSKICSVAILEDKKIILEKHSDDERTHSQKLMPIIDSVFKETKLTLDDIELLACCQGPGSFTGIRIGISTVKAFADVKNIPIVGITSLESLAYNIKNNSIIASIIDAKNTNVYFAMYELKDGKYKQIIEPIATDIYETIQKINSVTQNLPENRVIAVGDGAIIHQNLLKEKNENIQIASASECIQTSVSVGLAALDKIAQSNYKTEYSVSPIYLKKSQAERNLEEKK